MIIASTSNHSTWFPVLHEGLNFHTWQQYTTTGYAEDLYVAWVRQPSALGCSHFIITAAITDNHTINTGIDTRVEEGCLDEGMCVSSNCTFNDCIIFNVTFDKRDPYAPEMFQTQKFPSQSLFLNINQIPMNQQPCIHYFGDDNIISFSGCLVNKGVVRRRIHTYYVKMMAQIKLEV